MLMGDYKHNIDAKGRVIIPTKFRDVLGEKFVLTHGLDGCLFGYPLENWQDFREKLMTKLPLSQKNARKVNRFFIAAANEVEFDKQGRIMIPTALREFAALSKKCRIVGVSDRLEIWDEVKWQQYLQDTESNMSELIEDMGEFEF